MKSLPETSLLCDLTQSYAPHGGGGISCYLREKRRHLLDRTGHRLLQIVPGPEDRVVEQGRHVWVEVGADPVRGSPNYRFILRTAAVREVLERYQPAVIESQCPWVLPWTAINHGRTHPGTALVAGYHTDFPNAHVHRVASDLVGGFLAGGLRRLSLNYAQVTYRQFDRVFALSDGLRDMLAGIGIDRCDVLSLGVDTELFHPQRRDPAFRASLGLQGQGPLLVYAGRLDNEKRADRLLALMRHLPRDLGAALVLIGDGKLHGQIAQAVQSEHLPVILTGFMADRDRLAVALASADIYVSAMADETFGISVIEAQSSGLPVVGVASGAMIDRVPPGLGLLGPVDDMAVMARHVMAIWQGGQCRAMGAAARDHVAGRFTWQQTFERLLGEVYPRAWHRRNQRLSQARRWIGAAASEPELLAG